MYYEEKKEKDSLMFTIYLAHSYFCPASLKSFLTHHSGQKKQKQMNKEKSPKEKNKTIKNTKPKNTTTNKSKCL